MSVANNPLVLRELSVYNPGAQSEAALKQNFIARTEVLDELLAGLMRESSTSVARHVLLIGQRGMGKTTLLHRLELAVRETPELDAIWLPLTFPEEQYNIASLGEFWRNCFDALIDTVERRQLGDTKRLDALQERLLATDSDGALRALMEAAANLKKRPLLLIDNLDFVLERISETEAWALRAELQRPGGSMVIGSAVQPLEQGFSYSLAFYDFLHARFLDAMNFAETRALVSELALRHQRPEIAEEMRHNPARLSPLQLFTGGNPRTVVLLFRVLAQGLDHGAQKDIEDLLDLCTPLYKARIEALPMQQQRIFIDIALAYDPQTANDVDQRLKLGINAVSAQLNKMLRSGVLRKGPNLGKRFSFEVAERFFNIWYLMRASRRERNKLIWLARFLRDWYANDPKALCKAAADLMTQNSDPAAVYAVMEMTDGLDEARALRQTVRSGLSDSDRRIYAWADIKKTKPAITDKQWASSAKEFSLRFRRHYDWALPLLRELRADLEAFVNWNAAEAATQELLKDAARCIQVLTKSQISTERSHGLGRVLQESPERTTEAEAYFREAICLDQAFAAPWLSLGNLLSPQVTRRSEALDAYRAAIKLDQKYWLPWINLGSFLSNELQRHSEAEYAYRRAISLDPHNERHWTGLGILLWKKLRRFDEAEEAFQHAITAVPNSALPRNSLGNLLKVLNRHAEAEDAYRLAIGFDPTSALPWNNLGKLLSHHLQRHAEAEAAYKKAINLEPRYALPWSNLGWLLSQDTQRQGEAEAAFRQAIGLEPTEALNWNNLGVVLCKHLNRFVEAEDAFRHAIRLDPKNEWLWFNLGELLANRPDRYTEAENAYVQSISCSRDAQWAWLKLQTLWAQNFELARGQTSESIHNLLSLAAIPPEPPDAITQILELLWQAGKAQECYAAAQQTGLLEKLRPRSRPLIEALQMTVENKPQHLATLAAEVREASYLVLKRYAPEFAQRVAQELPSVVASFTMPERIERG